MKALATLAFVAAAVLLAAPALAQQQLTGKALVVGINEYAPPNTLGCCVADAQFYEQFCRGLGLEVTVLLDRQASKSAVRQAIRQAGGGCGPNDIFIFCYSGHGAQQPDDNGDEADGVDESMVMVDSAGQPEFYIDDEFDADMSQCHGALALSFLDCCHSGGAPKNYRAVGRRIRSYIDKGYTDGTKPLQLKRAGRDEGFAADSPSMANAVVLTACKPDELAAEFSNLNHGIFTYQVLDAVTNGAPAADTNGDGAVDLLELYQAVRQKVADATGGEQNPCIGFGSGKDYRTYKLIRLRADGTTNTMPQAPTSQGGNISGLLDTMVATMEQLGVTEKPRYRLDFSVDKQSYRPGETVNVSLGLDADAYVYLVNIYYGGDTLLLFPNGANSNNLVRGGSRLSIPDITGGYDLSVTESSRAGTEYLLCIASPVPLNLESRLPHRLTQDNVFGEFNSSYGTRGVMAQLIDQVYAGTKPLQLTKPGAGAHAGGATEHPSLAAVYVSYTVQ